MNINPGDGDNTVNLLDFTGNTTVTATGAGDNNISARSATGGTLNIDASAPAAATTLSNSTTPWPATTSAFTGGSGNDTFQFAGSALNPATTVNIDGGGGVNTLLFDSTGLPISAGPNGLPTTPSGNIQIAGAGYGSVAYSNIQDIPGYVGATVNAGAAYTIAMGQSLNLSGAATPATASTIESESWDLNGDGIYGDATGYTPTVSWATLLALGLGQPGTYTIGFRVKSDSNTTDAFTQLTITNTPPTLTVNAPGNATVGVPYTIAFSGAEVGANPITSWQVKWSAAGPVVNLPSDATSASFAPTDRPATTM